MKITASIVICLVVATAVSQEPRLSPMEELRDLRAQNRLLKAQVKSLKRRLKELKAEMSAPASKPASQPATEPATSTGPATRPQVGGSIYITITLHEEDPKWWVDPAKLSTEVVSRDVIGKLEPRHTVDAWLARNKWFIGKEVKWSLKVSECDVLTESSAGMKYFRVLKNKEAVEARVAKHKKDPKAGTREVLKRAIASGERQIREYRSQSAQYKALMDAKGGTLVTLKLQERGGFTVTVAAPRGQKVDFGEEMEVSGRITGVAAAPGDGLGALRVALIAQ